MWELEAVTTIVRMGALGWCSQWLSFYQVGRQYVPTLYFAS